MKTALVLLGLFLSATALADTVVSFGAGKGILTQGAPFERTVALALQPRLSECFFARLEAGIFSDNSSPDRSGSLWAAPALGMQAAASNGIETHLSAGPGFLLNPDSALGGHFQFSLEGGLGIADPRGVYIGVAWKHLSSAGIEMPNQGRDFVVIQFRLINIPRSL